VLTDRIIDTIVIGDVGCIYKVELYRHGVDEGKLGGSDLSSSTGNASGSDKVYQYLPG